LLQQGERKSGRARDHPTALRDEKTGVPPYLEVVLVGETVK
jgi:hypothetical protein